MVHAWHKQGVPCPDRRGSAKRGYRRLTREQVAMCRDFSRNMAELAREFGISAVAVFYVRHRYTYKELP